MHLNGPLRILYVGQLWEGSTTLDRMRCIEELGYEIVPFDITPYQRSLPRLSKSIAARFNLGKSIINLNKALSEFALNIREITHVWIDKGVWLWPETLKKIKEHTGAVLVHYSPDSHFFANKSRHFFKSIPLYDWIFTTKKYELEKYHKIGAQNVYLTQQSFEDTRFYPRPPEKAYVSDITFIGHCERHYIEKINWLVNEIEGAKIKIWGPGWVRYAKLARWSWPYVQGDGVWKDEYPQAISSSKINLCFLSKTKPDTSTTRSFEIPACGAFMLAERTAEHQAFFEEGKEAEFFGSDEEMVDKVKYYLSHPQRREMIAAAGRDRCLKSGYSNLARIREMLDKIKVL